MTIKEFKKRLKKLKPWKDHILVFGNERIKKMWLGYAVGKLSDLAEPNSYKYILTRKTLIERYIEQGAIK